MKEKTVDARGMLCPKPLLLTKEALRQLPPGRSLSVLVDNYTARTNIERFLKDNGFPSRTSEEQGIYRILTSGASARQPLAQSEPKEGPRPSGHVIAFRSDRMGSGPDELGNILMQAFIHTIDSVAPLPAGIVCYNTGVRLATEGSPSVEPLRRLEEKGIPVLVCGTCLDYFRLKDKVGVGTVSNLYSILEVLTAAGHVLYP